MATIRTAIMVDDRMSGAFRAMNNALNIVVNSFADLQDATHQAVDVSSIQAARTELARAEATLNQVESSIQNATQNQRQFNDSIGDANPQANNLLSKFKQIATTIGGIIGLKKVMDLSDQVSQTTARLNLMNDGQQTTAELQRMIYESAQRSRGEYQATANTVARLGITAKDAFESNAETVAFAEQLNKQFIIGGANAQEMAAVLLQISQALGSGVLRGDELNSVFEQAPTIIETIADYLQVPIGEIRDMAGNGEITAQIVKNAMLAATDETNAKFESMPKTFGQVATSIQNKALMMFQPLLVKMNEIANSERFNSMTDGVLNGIYAIATACTYAFELVSSVGGFVVDNWSILQPIIFGVAAAILLYNGAVIAKNIVDAISIGLQTAQAIAIATKTGATIADVAATNGLTVSQWALNSAFLACPITWIIAGIIAIIAIIYTAVAVFNKFAGTSVSATGIVAGVFTTLGAHIANRFVVPTWNTIAAFVNFFGNVWHDPVAAVKVLFYDMCLTVIGYITNMAHAIENVINKIPGVTVDITSGLDGFQSKLESASQKVKDESGWIEYVGKMDYIDYGDAAKAGYNFGKGIDDKVGSLFDFSSLGLDDYGAGIDLGDLSSTLGSIDDNTGKTADNTDTSTEDLKYLRDIAERETINRFTTAEIKVDMGGISNTVNNMSDLDGIADYLAIKVEEQMQIAAEGVHE